MTAAKDNFDYPLLWLGMAVLPMMLWFVEQILPYPVIIEEAAKAVVVYCLYKQGRSVTWKSAMGLGLVFGFAEAALFMVNANLLQSASGLLWRLILTVPMHAVTTTIIFVFWKTNWWLGVLLAMLVHGLFNFFVPGLI